MVIRKNVDSVYSSCDWSRTPKRVSTQFIHDTIGRRLRNVCRLSLFITRLVEYSKPGVDTVYSSDDWLILKHSKPSEKLFLSVQ